MNIYIYIYIEKTLIKFEPAAEIPGRDRLVAHIPKHREVMHQVVCDLVRKIGDVGAIFDRPLRSSQD